MVPIVVIHMLLHPLKNLQIKSLFTRHPHTMTHMHSFVLVWSNCMLFFFTFTIVCALWHGHGEGGVENLFRTW